MKIWLTKDKYGEFGIWDERPTWFYSCEGWYILGKVCVRPNVYPGRIDKIAGGPNAIWEIDLGDMLEMGGGE